MNREKGQVFPLTALMLVVLIGAAALAIDVSTSLNQQRRQQQDLDTVTKLVAAGYSSTQASNFLKSRGYDTSSFVLQAPSSGPYAGKPSCLASTAVDGCYVEGYLTQNLQSFFGNVLGFHWMKVSVHAVAEKGGSYVQPAAMLSLSPDGSTNGGCGILIQGSAANGQIVGDVRSNSQTCVKTGGNVTVVGSVYSDVTTTTSNGAAITGTVNGDSGNGTGGVMLNPYDPGVFPNTGSPPIIVTTLTTQIVCGYTIAAGDTYLQPADNTGVAVVSVLPPSIAAPSLLASNTTDFLPYCDPSGNKTAGIYVFNTDLQMSCGGGLLGLLSSCPVVNVKDSTFVFNYAAGARIQMTGGTLNMVGPDGNSPFYDPKTGSIAMWQENTPAPCSNPTSMKLAGQTSGTIKGIVDLQCTDVTLTGNSSSTPFIDGVLVAWDITLAGNGVGVGMIDPGVDPGLPRGAVLVQ